MAMGQLVDELERDQVAARAEFAERFDAFAAKPQRQLVRETFAMSRVLATYNIKGGVGKTSAAVNLAYLAARDGAPHAGVGPRSAGREHVPVPDQAAGQGRRRGSWCAARATSTR